MAANTTPALSISDLSFRWQRNGGFALEADRFDIKRGERVLMTAPSGAGKTTLISLMAGIMRPDNGSIRIGDHDLVAMRPAQRDRFRADNIGLIFQSLNLIPYLTALENIVLPLRLPLLGSRQPVVGQRPASRLKPCLLKSGYRWNSMGNFQPPGSASASSSAWRYCGR